MVSTIAPDKDNYMAIVMKEKARTRPRDRIYKMPSDLLNFDVRIPNNAQLDLFAAARQGTGRIGVIRDLIESGRASATKRDEDGITPLHLAVISGRVPVCAYLIDQGAEVNAFGGTVPATPLQWAARKGTVDVIDLLVQHGANPRLVDAQDFSCLHSVTHSSDHWALLYMLCQPDIVVDERDNMGLTPLHWAALQGNNVSVEVLLKFGANPNLVDHNGLTALHWAACGGNRSCISQLLEAGVDIRVMNRDHRKAQEMADRYNNSKAWNAVVQELGFKANGTRVRRPLSEPGVKIIIISTPIVVFCVTFTIASIFPWQVSIVLSLLAIDVMDELVDKELLQRDTVKETLQNSPYCFGIEFGYALWVAYAWVTRLRYDLPDNPAIHTMFLFLFVVSMLTLFLAVFCDSGSCATETKEGLKPTIEDLVRRNCLDTFCIKCMVVRPQRTWHCTDCNKCVMGGKSWPFHDMRVLNCIGMNNYKYYMVFLFSYIASILMFDYLAWKHFLALKDTPLPSDLCVLPDTVCKRVSADMFLVSITVWSPVEVIACGWDTINEVWSMLRGTTSRKVLPPFSPTVTYSSTLYNGRHILYVEP